MNSHIRVYPSFMMNMSDSLTSGDFPRVALEKLFWITLSSVKGMSVVIFFRVRVILNVCPHTFSHMLICIFVTQYASCIDPFLCINK